MNTALRKRGELGRLYLGANNVDKAKYYLERSLHISPYDRDVYIQLAELYADAGAYGNAARARLAVLGLNPVDRAEAFYQYALTLNLDSRPADAKRAVLQSLELAPGYREAQHLLLEIVDGGS